MRRTVIACAIWACVLPMGSQAVVLGNQQSQELVQRGLDLVTSGQLPQAREQFDEGELVDLTIAVSTINSWNRLAVSFRQTPSD